MSRPLRVAFAVCAGLALTEEARSGMQQHGAARRDKIAVETFSRASAYPFDGMIPEQNIPFLEGPPGARYHISPRGGTLMEATTYSDRRSLLAMPARFNPSKPGAAIILFFHGNRATLRDVEERQGVPRQLFASRMNAVLVAPQLAVDALDSSPGHFYDEGFLDQYLDEADDHLIAQSRGRFTKDQFAALPVIIVAYSGGYVATAFSLHYARPGSRIRGVVLLDALFGESAKIEDWIEKSYPNTFFLSAFSKSSSEANAALETALQTHGIPVRTDIPKRIGNGDVIFLSVPDAVHNDFVTRAWTTDPLRAILNSIQVR